MCLFPRIGKNFNDLYYFQKVKKYTKKNKKCIYFYEVEK